MLREMLLYINIMCLKVTFKCTATQFYLFALNSHPKAAIARGQLIYLFFLRGRRKGLGSKMTLWSQP